MADGIVPPAVSEGRVASGTRGVVAFYHAVMAEMKKVTWPEVPDVRRATVAILIFVILLALLIYIMDVALQGVLANLIPSLFSGR
jgi:preprotein translocase subunit SecE